MCLQESNRKGTAILCDNIGSYAGSYQQVLCAQFHLEKKGMHAITLAVLFHHNLITLRVAWEIFPIRNVHFSFGKILIVYKL